MRTRNTGTLKQIIEALGDHVPPDALAGEEGCFAGSECQKLRLDPGRFRPPDAFALTSNPKRFLVSRCSSSSVMSL